MKKVRVITQGKLINIEVRRFFFWRNHYSIEFDPDAFGSHEEKLKLAFRLSDTVSKSLNQKRKEEIRL